MANTLKDLAASSLLVSQVALEKALIELKSYIDTQDAAGSADTASLSARLDALIGAVDGDADKLLNTFNDIKAFLADYDEDDTLKSLIDAVNTAVSNEATRATNAEGQLNTAIGNEVTRATNAETALGGRITTLENINIMTATEAETLFDSVFNPSQEQGD